jgi:hypothetical protein
MSTFKRLAKKIKQDTGFDVTELERTYTGIHQQSHGAFVWRGIYNGHTCGSTVTATELLKQDKITVMEQITLGNDLQFI